MMLLGKSTWQFPNPPVILTSGTVGGPFEADGKLRAHFDRFHEDLWLEQKSFEQAQQIMMEEACDIALKKHGIEKEQINFLISGDLINQITPTTYAAGTIGTPYFGLFSACATSTEGLALSAAILNSGGADYILSGTASHNAAAERQFRYPTEYGGQKPPTAQWTVTGAGVVLLGRNGDGPVVTAATIGKVVDMGLTDPFNMGGAMAPAAAETIIRHLQERQVSADYYDLIVTGDLGKIGRESAYDLMKERGVTLNSEHFLDCGLLIYADHQPVQSGGSGTACSAVVTYGYLLDQMRTGKLNRILLVATGSLHSPMTVQQKGTIPCIAHAVAIENGSDVK